MNPVLNNIKKIVLLNCDPLKASFRENLETKYKEVKHNLNSDFPIDTAFQKEIGLVMAAYKNYNIWDISTTQPQYGVGYWTNAYAFLVFFSDNETSFNEAKDYIEAVIEYNDEIKKDGPYSHIILIKNDNNDNDNNNIHNSPAVNNFLNDTGIPLFNLSCYKQVFEYLGKTENF